MYTLLGSAQTHPHAYSKLNNSTQIAWITRN